MKGWDPAGELGPNKPLPDSVHILEPPEDKIIQEPTSEPFDVAPVVPPPPPAAEEPAAYQPPPQQPAFEQQYDQADPF